MSAVADLLTLLGALIVVIGGTCGYWVYRDAREAAAERKRQADAADARVRRVAQARDARYLTDEPGRPE